MLMKKNVHIGNKLGVWLPIHINGTFFPWKTVNDTSHIPNFKICLGSMFTELKHSAFRVRNFCIYCQKKSNVRRGSFTEKVGQKGNIIYITENHQSLII